MARLIVSALELAGHRIALASDFRSYEGTGDTFLQEAMAAAGRVEAEEIIRTFLDAAPENRPDVWFTYHLYYKAPDYIGPLVSDALNIPYVVAEPSHAPKRANGPWKSSHAHVESCLKKTDCAFCLTRHDMACVKPALASPERLFFLPPFLDPTPFQHERSAFSANRSYLAEAYDLTADVLLVTVGMMRPGDKFESYRQLADALAQLDTDLSWQLVVVGDGEAAAETKDLFRKRDELAEKTVFTDELGANEVARILGATDIYVWPAAGEAYGMALLEAQAAGLPVIAGNLRGVPDVVQDGETAFLTPPDDTTAFADKLQQLMDNKPLRVEAGLAAGRFVAGERSLQQAADILDRGLAAALKTHGAKT